MSWSNVFPALQLLSCSRIKLKRKRTGLAHCQSAAFWGLIRANKFINSLDFLQCNSFGLILEGEGRCACVCVLGDRGC